MTPLCEKWELKFNEYPEMNLAFGSEIRPVIGGTKNYEDLTGKPRINGVELLGDKTNEDIDIRPITNSELEEILKNFK